MKIADKPCVKCGWKFKTFHICLDASKEDLERVEDGRTRDSNGKIDKKVVREQLKDYRLPGAN